VSDERSSPEKLRESGDPWFYVVEDRTHFVRSFCRNAEVLDAPCGIGWSTASIAKVANRVVGVDLNANAIATAKAKYSSENIEFKVMSCLALDVLAESFDVVASLEAIEHFSAADGPAYIAGIAKALRPGGVLVGTTPSASDAKAAVARRINEKNPYHLKIYWQAELRRVLSPHFNRIWIETMPFGCFYFVAHKKLGLKQTVRNLAPASLRPFLTWGRGVVRKLAAH
jgi:SAM-dependent methyltransferase